VEMIEYSELMVEPGSKELTGLAFKKKSLSQPVIDQKNKKSFRYKR